MNKEMIAIGTGLAGAGLMYLLDPTLGRRRRALFLDKTGRYSRAVGRGLDTTARDLGTRIQGLVAEGKRTFAERTVPDDVLIERVRAELGRAVSHPSSIVIHTDDGHVTLSGPLLQHERDRLIRRIRKVRGVRSVGDQLDLHTDSGTEPGLQGQPARTPTGRWPPAKRALAIGTGLGALFVGSRWRNLSGAALACAGTTLMTRGIANRGVLKLFGLCRRAESHFVA
ncbi:MAG TPA: BON domain-containing protein [Terriglobia bacterium]|nr:BON domain-containing protein [Terriglobia bacterium]